MLRRMSDPRAYECRWIKRKIPGSFKLILQQFMPHLPSMLPIEMRKSEWVDVPVLGEQNDESTVRMAKSQSGPQDAPTQVTTALEPFLRSPEEIERVIEKQMLVLTGLMKLRTDMSGFPPYDGTLVLVHGATKQRMFVNGFERSMPATCLLITNDEDIHNFQIHTVSPSEANKRKPT